LPCFTLDPNPPEVTFQIATQVVSGGCLMI
jgi:hypothetical protein